ncbi:MAG: nucleoside hydrolase [Actinomycetia bacterium]|nr:nucleoside hydrolase [Actinomycetes bacterium]
MRIWIDTDIGSDVDDALTLAYILGHPGFELVGISTVFGDVALRSRIASALLERAGAEKVPVLDGMGVPLTARRRGIMFGNEGVGLLDDPDPVLRLAEEEGAEARIGAIIAAMAEAEPDVVLAIGPLTNLGVMVQMGAELPPLALMGGKFSDVAIEYVVGEVGEWNWFSDPDAARLVLDAAVGAPVRPLVLPAEITFQTRLADGDIDKLAAAGDDLSGALAVLCQGWLDLQRVEFERSDPRVALHDPLTAAVLVRPQLCSFEPRRVTIEDSGAAVDQPGEANVDVAVAVDPRAVRDEIMATLLGGDSAG